MTRAAAVYSSPEQYGRLLANVYPAAQRLSWDIAARDYAALYRAAVEQD